MRKRCSALAMGVAMLCAAHANAREGELDPGFAASGKRRIAFDRGGTETGKADHLVDLIRLPDGKLVALGTVTDDGDHSVAGLVRISANGDVDAGFGENGRALLGTLVPITARGIGRQPDGRLVVVGVQRDSPGFAVLLRANAAGDVDAFPGSSFNTTVLDIPGSDVTDVAGLEMLADGRFLVYGTLYDNGLQNRDFFVARLTANGALDASFGVSAGYTRVDFDLDFKSVDIARGLARSPDGRIALIGEASAGDAEAAIAMLDADGDLLASFDEDGRAIVDFDVGQVSQDHGQAACFRLDGKLVVAADIDFASPAHAVGLAVLNASGSLMSGFGEGSRVRYAAFVDTFAARLACVPGNRTVMLGSFETPAAGIGPSEVIAVRFDGAGATDTSFGQSFGAEAFGLNRGNLGREDRGMALVAGAAGEFFVGFDAQYQGADYDYGLARLQGSGLFKDGFEP